jgi:hypothetical protein
LIFAAEKEKTKPVKKMFSAISPAPVIIRRGRFYGFALFGVRLLSHFPLENPFAALLGGYQFPALPS